MSPKFVVLLIFLLCSKETASWSGPYSCVQKTKTLNVLTAYVSNWVTNAEYQNIMTIAEPLVYANTSCSAVGSAIVAKITTIFTPAQYSQILALVASLTFQLPLGPISYATLLTNLKNVLFNNLCPFYSQVQTFIKYNAWNHTELGTVQNVYRFINEFWTIKRCCTVLQRLAQNFNSSGTWTPVPCAGVILITYFHRKREKREFLPRYQVDRPHIWDNYEKYYDDPTKRPDYPESLDTLSIDDSYYKKAQKIESCTKSPTLSIRRDPWRESTGWGSRTTLENIKKEQQKRYTQMYLMDKSCREIVHERQNN
uniref:Uncharacterized protein n=1 Tax=Acrobeloides nanus TaxID=290746 RepID=A0A914C1D6_9BILA